MPSWSIPRSCTDARGGDDVSDPDFDATLSRARGGDAAAWADLYDEVGSLVRGYLRAQRLPDPDDVSGEVLLQVVRDLDRFEGDRRAFRSWVLTIAHHRMLDERRRMMRKPSVATAPEELDAGASPHETEALVVDAEADERVAALLTDLTEDQRSVLLLRVVGDMTLKEVAKATGKRVGAVKALQHRAVEALRRKGLDPSGVEP